MERKFDVVGLGELLIDFTDAGYSRNGQRIFEQNPGGAPSNLLTAVSHAGGKTAFIGKVGSDMHGLFLKSVLDREKIDTSGLIVDRNVFTTLAFVALQPDGEREFSFARKPGADTMLRADEVDREILKATKVFHVGSLSLTDEPSRTATVESVTFARAAGAVISYDPNYRASLWNSREEAVERILSLMAMVDLMKVSDEESELLTGEKDCRRAAEKLLSMGPAVVVVTRGSEGAYAASKSGFTAAIPGFTVKAVDATGAGDTFWGGFLSQYVKAWKRPEELTEEDLKEYMRFGNAMASLCVQKRGGIPSIPYEQDVLQVLSGRTE